MYQNKTRREFLEFMGRGALLASVSPLISSCSISEKKNNFQKFLPIPPSTEDRLILASPFKYTVLASWGDTINSQGETFGFNCDYIACLPSLAGDFNEQIIWVNHESVNPIFVSGYQKNGKRTKQQVEKEQLEVGGSFIKIQRQSPHSPWKMVKDDKINRRFSGKTKIPFVADRKIAGSDFAIGTLGNCAGGVTPWNTILTCEENYYHFYGEVKWKDNQPVGRKKAKYLKWDSFFDYSPLHYGWVVECNPSTGKSKKLTSMGRFAHECATVVLSKEGYPVVYLTDDKNDECLYKMVSKDKNSLDRGELFVADTVRGRWVSLDINKQPLLQKHFKDQTEVLIRTREAARIVGGTPLDRPEDVERDPRTGSMYITLTNNKPKGNFHGSILKIEEENSDSGSMQFKASTFLVGGKDSGFSCPDNLVFDHHGDLWMASDIAGDAMGNKPYDAFGNNGLFYIPMSGPQAGEVMQVASAPKDAEFTGPCFSKDGKTLFLSVQHPGETSESIDKLTSHWPDGGSAIPKPSVIAIEVG